jgi:hypothetical protein
VPSRSNPGIYRELLRPSWWLFGFALIGALALGIAYGSALGIALGLTVFVLTAIFLTLGLFLASPRIVVASDYVQAGPALLPREAMGEIHVLDASEMRDALNLRTAPASSFTLARSWAAPQGVRLELADSADPHQVWLLSSRHPRQLADALRRLRDRMDA